MGKTLRCLNTSPSLCNPPSQQNWLEIRLQELTRDPISLLFSVRPEIPAEKLVSSAVRMQRETFICCPKVCHSFAHSFFCRWVSPGYQDAVHVVRCSTRHSISLVYSLCSALLLQEFCRITEPESRSAKPLAQSKSKEGCKCY